MPHGRSVLARTLSLAAAIALVGLLVYGFATKTPPCSPQSPVLRALVGGGGGEIVLQWTNTTPNVTRWQYRQRGSRWGPGSWGTWTDVPDSAADTTTHRVTGLRKGSLYGFQVRPWTTEADDAYDEVVGVTAYVARDGIPYADGGLMLEGGRTFRLPEGGRLVGWAFDVPEGMLLMASGSAINEDRESSLSMALVDVLNSSYLLIDMTAGEYVERHVTPPGTGPLHSPVAGVTGNCEVAPGVRDVHALFDQIIASTRPLP